MIVTTDEYLALIQAATGVAIPDSGQTLLTQCAPWIQRAIERIIGYSLPSVETTSVEYYPETLVNYEAGGDFLVGNWDLINGAMVAQSRGEQYRNVLALRNLPVRSITEIRENLGAYDMSPPCWPDSSIIPANDYYLDAYRDGYSDTGKVIRTGGIWTRQLRCIKCTYIYGMSQDEIDTNFGDLKLAVAQSIQAFYLGTVLRSQAGQSGGLIASTSITNFSQSFADPKAMGLYFQNDYAIPPDVAFKLSRYVNLRRYI